MISGVAVALPSLGADLGAGATALSLVETLFLASSVALLLPAGRLGDAADKVAIYKSGLLGFALTSIAVGLVSSTAAVLVLRFVQGIFVAGGIATLALLAPTHLLLKIHWRRPAPGAVHLPSAALATLAMLVLVGGASSLREGPLAYAAVAAGLALCAVFVWSQRRLEQPLLNVQLVM